LLVLISSTGYAGRGLEILDLPVETPLNEPGQDTRRLCFQLVSQVRIALVFMVGPGVVDKGLAKGIEQQAFSENVVVRIGVYDW
jgi:hypothetical protein